MNKNKKIIISIVGITIVLLALLGLTYAYYLTRIEGNTNTNSISVTTANLQLLYNDGDGSIIGSGKTLIPDNDNPVGTKVFTVTNNGNETVEDYAVIVENLAIKYHSGSDAGKVTSLINGEDGEPDMKLVIGCKSYKNYGKSGQEEVGTCNGMDGFLPEKSDILLTNTIDKDITHEYTATLTYLEDGTNQSDDMNKIIEGKFNIIDTKNTVDITGTVATYNKGDKVTINSEYKESVIYTDGTYKLMGVKPDVHTIKVVGENTTEIGKISIKGGTTASTTGTTTNNGVTIPEVTITNDSRVLTINLKGNLEVGTMSDLPKATLLADTIIDNVKNGDLAGKTIFVENLSATGMVDNVTNAGDKILSTANDDYTASTGKQSYYFRGNPIDNYVEFSGMCWRIVRIQGDGSIKLILASELSCSEENLTSDSGYATNGARGAKGTILTAHYGYKSVNGYSINDYINSPEANSTSARTQLNAWLDRKITAEEQQKYLKDENWCIGDLTNAYSYDDTGEIVGNVDEMILNGESFEYTAGNKYWVTKIPSYICETTGKTGEIDTNKVGMLTFDEIVYAGGGKNSNSNYYLYNNATTNYWWALSPYNFLGDFGFVISFLVDAGGRIDHFHVGDSSIGLRVAVSLKSSVVFKDGDGTLEKPYILG